jgi:diguanylate cyclase (GGDEF)-like protein
MSHNARELFQRLKQTNRLPSPPGVAMRVLELAENEDASVREIADAICTDPVLTAKILKLVNSPSAGMPKKVSSLRQAIGLIGMRSVKMVALSFSLVGLGKTSALPEFDLNRYWSRSLARAVAARTISRTHRSCDPEEAFVAGLLSDFGQLIMASQMPEAYSQVLVEAATSVEPLDHIETRMVGASRTLLTAELLEAWRFPETIAHAIRCFRETGSTGLGTPLITALFVADLAADLICAAESRRPQDPDILYRHASTLYGWSEAQWHDLFTQTGRDWKEYGSILSIETGQFRSFADLQAEAQERIAEMTLEVHVENQRSNRKRDELIRQANTDNLTGLGNRAAFDDRLCQELSRALRKGNSLALAMIDLDRFKEINDTLGHLAGDYVLKAVGATIQDNVRTADFPARFGGEEFVVVAPECNPADAATFADRLRANIEALSVNFEGAAIHVTASIGIVVLPEVDVHHRPEDLIRAADVLMYRAKQAGRNTVKVGKLPGHQAIPAIPTLA